MRKLEPVGSAVFAVEPLLAVREAARHAAFAFGRVGTIEEGDVLVADVAEPGKVLSAKKMGGALNQKRVRESTEEITKHTNGSYSCPRRGPARLNERERRPISRRRNRLPDPGG